MRAFVLQAVALLGLFVLVTAIAELLGAEDLGTAASFGQIAFVAGVAYMLVRRDPS